MVPMRVVIADASPVYRTALRTFLAGLPGIMVVGEAHDGPTVLRLVRETAPDLLTLDINMFRNTGWKVLHELRSNGGDMRILLLTSYLEPHVEQQALQWGAVASIRKGGCGFSRRDP